MKKSLVLFGCTLLLSAVGSASIVCPTSTYDVYTTTVNGSGGCTITTPAGASKLFNNFGFTFTSAGAPVALTPASVSVTPVNTPEEGFVFNLPLAAGPNQTADVTLTYNATVQGNAPLFNDATLTMNGAGFGTGAASISDLLCLGGRIIGGCAGGTLQNLATIATSNPATTVLSQHITFAPVATVDISKDINVTSNGANGSANLSSASNTLSQVGVPEPVTLLLMGSGLLALGVMRRSRRA